MSDTPEDDAYEVVFTRGARRALEAELPRLSPQRRFELIDGPLRAAPRRVGKPSRNPLTPLWSARRGDYRVLYRIDDGRLVVDVVTVRHRRDAYRR